MMHSFKAPTLLSDAAAMPNSLALYPFVQVVLTAEYQFHMCISGQDLLRVTSGSKTPTVAQQILGGLYLSATQSWAP